MWLLLGLFSTISYGNVGASYPVTLTFPTQSTCDQARSNMIGFYSIPRSHSMTMDSAMSTVTGIHLDKIECKELK